MRIDKKLNLVVPFVRSDGMDVYSHSTPIGSDVFDKYFLELSKTANDIIKLGMEVTGPRIADKMLKRVAEQFGTWPDVERGLVNEMRRLTMVVFPGERGWDQLMFDDACKKEVLDVEDAAEVLAAVTFFTASLYTLRREQRPLMLEGAMSAWGARIESSSCTEFTRSLPTLTVGENSGAKVASLGRS